MENFAVVGVSAFPLPLSGNKQEGIPGCTGDTCRDGVKVVQVENGDDSSDGMELSEVLDEEVESEENEALFKP
jgi:hypothetical protein